MYDGSDFLDRSFLCLPSRFILGGYASQKAKQWVRYVGKLGSIYDIVSRVVAGRALTDGTGLRKSRSTQRNLCPK